MPDEETTEAELQEPNVPAHTLEPAPIGVTAIVGHSGIGPVGRVESCNAVSEFNRHFGGFEEAPVLASSVKGFFENGGKRCLILNLGETARTLTNKDLAPLDDEAELELLCAPGKTEPQDYQCLISHCVEVGTRFALLDAPQDLPTHMARFRPPSGREAAIYSPWLQSYDAARAEVVPVPPSAHMAGLYTKVATDRGLGKAPANEALLGIEGLSYEYTQAEQDILYPRGVNCIRRMPRVGGFRPWGAQSLGERAPFQSISPFRVFSYVVRSFRTGCSWLLESNSDPELWEQLLEAGNAFLTELVVSGALVGGEPEKGFRLRCDAQLNDPSRRDSGLVVLEIGLALVRPSTFFTFQLGLDLSE